MKPPGARIELLKWDSEFWQARIARATPPAKLADELARASGFDCVFLLVPIEEIAEAHDAARLGFRLTDVRVEYRMPAHETDSTAIGARQGDIDRIVELARSSFRRTRFYNDPRFPDAGVDVLYETWARNSCADADVIVVEREQRVQGFVTLEAKNGEASIGLIAVDADARRQGVGHDLMAGALNRAAWRGYSEVSVATQGGNLAAQRLFQSWGGRSSSVALWWHKWMDE